MGDKKTVPVYCYQCVAGPDLLKVEVEDGVATRIASNFDIRNEHPGGGRVCVKAYGLIQKTYNPERIQQPMKRTNPHKGREQDPEFVPISWDEALGLIAGQLKSIRAKGILDESGYPRVAASFGGGGTPTQYMGTFPAFLSAWGKVDLGFGAGQGVKCYHSEHLYGELWHRAFIVAPDSPYTNYIISCGHNGDASAGVAGVWRHADARVRGMKRVQVEPHLSVTGALAAEWLPIKPKTDAAFLYALINRIVHERDWQEVCDVPFLTRMTNAPYLVGPNGYYLREAETLKPLIFDRAAAEARPYDADIDEPQMLGAVAVSGVEDGPDGKRWKHRDIEAKPAFQLLLDHVREYTPEWAAGECDVPAENIRRIADEYVEQACVGETIDIEGHTLPFRPVAILLGKTVNNGWGGYQCCWARTLLGCLVGALEVPGSMIGTNVKLNRPADNRFTSAVPNRDGFMDYPFNPTSSNAWQRSPTIRNAYQTLVPLVANSPWSPALGPAHLPWLFLKEPPAHWQAPTRPELWFNYRTNPAISAWNNREITERLSEFPFIVSFGYTRDETNHMADVILPEATDLESLQLMQIGNTKFIEQLWKHEGWAIRQPVIDSPVDCRDMTDIASELAERVGLLEKYNSAINRGAGGIKLKTDSYDYGLDVSRRHSVEETWDAVARAASHDLSDGEQVHGLDWFREHGYMLRPFAQFNWYLYPHLERQGMRFEMPYQERILRHGTELARRLHESGVEWWDKQLDEYQPLPAYERFPDIWIDYTRQQGADPAEYPLWALTARSMQYSWGANVGIPIINEVAQNVSGHRGVIINRTTARELGLVEGDPVVIESIAGVTHGYAVTREGIRPDTVLMIGQFDHWATPFAKDLKLPSLNSVQSLALELTDATGSTSDIARVKIRRGDGPRRQAA
ncbi:MAG: molybdopterin-dependent oxidoreductase [Gammaproteobacteria bacterium]|nr:molybdopterin-dependent oxidoreductase [Gammaproteobacteria bacterium]